ncbi:hypothetical protein PTKIN_Ptkin03bG0179500 [Pterospermum kingtungense]
MGVAVLNPEDCLKLPFPLKHPKYRCPNPNPHRTNRTQPNRKNNPPNTPRLTVGPKLPAKNPVMGQVKILKRGKELRKTAPEKHIKFEKENVDRGSTNRLGRDPESVPNQIRLNESSKNSNQVVPTTFYAGSAFITSPPPSSVPMPAFFTKKIDVVTSDLRRILRLDLQQ